MPGVKWRNVHPASRRGPTSKVTQRLRFYNPLVYPNAVYRLGGEVENIVRSHICIGKHGRKAISDAAPHGRKRICSALGEIIHKSIAGNRPALPQSLLVDQYGTARRLLTSKQKMVQLNPIRIRLLSTYSELHSPYINNKQSTIPPAYHWYEAKRPGGSLSLDGRNKLYYLTRFRSGHF
ncbi:hypothetical protein TNCV_176151 [Trichonephila clavipes]|nr:hypothetical protein TNCV_176151 [Trichonephila clavipes]